MAPVQIKVVYDYYSPKRTTPLDGVGDGNVIPT